MPSGTNGQIRHLQSQLEIAERKAEILSNMLKEAVNEYENAMDELRASKTEADRANRTKSEFLANMSHEIRTPMNAIIGLTNLTLKSELNSIQRAYLARVRTSSLHLLSLIDDILDFSKIEAGKMELESSDFMLNQLLDQVANLFREKAAEKDIELFYIIDRNVPLDLKGDPFRLEQILINLVSNAIKFTQQGEIIVRVQPDHEHAGVEAGQANILISVSDTGMGIAAEKLSELFTPFTQADGSITRKFGGSGLGLSICHRLVTMMNGTIGVKSTLGKGTTFLVSLPLDRGTAGKHYIMKAPPEMRGLKVLLVENKDTARTIIRQILKSFDFHVTAVASRREGLHALKMATYSAPYDLVLVDSGTLESTALEFARNIHAHSLLRSVLPKIIMITVHGLEDSTAGQDCAGSCPVDGYLFKPVNSSDLFNAVMEVFGKMESVVPKLPDGRVSEQLIDPEAMKGARILLVEDNTVNQDVAVAMLNRLEVSVDIAENGQEAVNMVRTEPAYDAVLMDVQMPVMDGFAATRLLREDSRFDEMPVIAMTAHALKGDREKCLDAGMNDYVSKPIDEHELYAALARWIRLVETKVPSPPARLPVREDPWESMPEHIPGIDISFGLKQLLGNTGLYRKVLRLSLTSFTQAREAIHSHLAAGDIQAAQRLSHNIKGVAGNIGATALFTAAGELDTCLRQESHHNREQLTELFIQELSKVTASLTALDLDPAGDRGGAVKMHPGPDLAAVARVMREMKRYLDMSSAKAGHSFLTLKGLLNGSPYQETLNSLEDALYMLDSEKSLPILIELADKLHISLQVTDP